MELPEAYAGADDATLVGGCMREDEAAWRVLEQRYGALVEATAVRAVGPAEIDLDSLVGEVWDHVRRSALGQWSPDCQLRSYLAVTARHAALTHTEARTSPAARVAPHPTPSGLFLDDLLALEPAARVEQTLDRLPPNLAALVRLRLRGLGHGDIAATLGMCPSVVRANLDKVATRLGQLDQGAIDTTPAWRVLLDAADPSERVALALRTEDDPDLRSARAVVQTTWRVVGERALGRPVPKSGQCLDDRAQAGFVDGTLRGAARARAEGHVGSCPRCIDEAAALVLDLRSQSILRDASELPSIAGAAAACLATTQLASAERLAQRASEKAAGPPGMLGDLRRIAQAGQLLEGGRARAREQASAVVPTHLPADDEAPLVAFEALCLEDPHTAWRAIDDRLARGTLGARLRLLAAAAGHDLDIATIMAREIVAQPPIDPAHLRDAQSIEALPRGRALPREVRWERLRALLPELVRFVLTRRS